MRLFKRVPIEDVTAAAHIVWADSDLAEKIAKETILIINKTFHRKPTFYNGRRAKSLVGGLFYLLGYRYDDVKRQNELADALGTSDVSIRFLIGNGWNIFLTCLWM
jgi:hypothetical protein